MPRTVYTTSAFAILPSLPREDIWVPHETREATSRPITSSRSAAVTVTVCAKWRILSIRAAALWVSTRFARRRIQRVALCDSLSLACPSPPTNTANTPATRPITTLEAARPRADRSHQNT